jgi:hypothetical protein
MASFLGNKTLYAAMVAERAGQSALSDLLVSRLVTSHYPLTTVRFQIGAEPGQQQAHVIASSSNGALHSLVLTAPLVAFLSENAWIAECIDLRSAPVGDPPPQ